MIAVYGLKFIAAGIILTILCILAASWRDSMVLFILAVLFAILTVFLTFFYRNPPRIIPDDQSLILSNADGKVLSVEEINDPVIGGRGYNVAVFLSVFNVHINRIPCDGVIEDVEYIEGGYYPAFKEEASVQNEQAIVRLRNKQGNIVFKQITGIMARRIENDYLDYDRSKPPEVKAGEIYGMIHFGSRAEILIPENTEILVKKGDRVKGGITPVARFK